jgi:hypothetical protein
MYFHLNEIIIIISIQDILYGVNTLFKKQSWTQNITTKSLVNK